MDLSVFLLLVMAVVVVAPPPQRVQAEQNGPRAGKSDNSNRDANSNANENVDRGKPLYEFTYSKYLEEVVGILESDPKFSERLRGMPEEDVKAGNIADHIDDLDSHVFDKLTKAKLAEIERLRELIQEQIKADGGAHNVKMPEHLDVTNWDKFGKEDLRKLIRRTVQDMEAMDKERREDFKEYEMRKKAEEDHKLAQMSDEERQKAEREAEEARKRHSEHEKLKHPGSRDQLEEVWEESDHMEKEAFDPRTFFALHDLNGDGFWNEDELEALFQVELSKVYNDTDPDDDPRERMEEMYRMREHVTKQMDKNGDRLISLQEFLSDTEAQTSNVDPGWKDLGSEQVYTDEELREFEKEYAKKQGWGENAYEKVTTLAPPPAQHQQQEGYHQQQHEYAQQSAYKGGQYQQQQQAVNVNAQYGNSQQAQSGYLQQQQQQLQQQVPIRHDPIVEKPKDPAYGI